jgi:hypothetical protein
MGMRMGRGMGEVASEAMKGKREPDNVGSGHPDISRLNRPATDAIVCVVRAMGRAIGRRRTMMRVRTLNDFGHPAHQGAGQDEARQKYRYQGSHGVGSERKLHRFDIE